MTRYARQNLLSQFSDDGQAKLAAAKVLIVGLGGLGSPVSQLLAGAGVGQLSLVDGDVVSESNLHRQTLYSESDVGKAKVLAAKRRLLDVNSGIGVTALNERLTISNAEKLVTDHTVVVDAADSFLVTYLLSDVCRQKSIPYVSASVLRTQGYLGVFCFDSSAHNESSNPGAANLPSYRAVFSSPPETSESCDTAGVTGPSVAVIGGLQAQEVLKVVLSDQTQLAGKIMYLDLWDYSQNIMDVRSAIEPEIANNWCSFDQLTADDILLDVRTMEEQKTDPAPANPAAKVEIPLSDLDRRIGELDTHQRIVCICKSGQRALNAASKLIDLGFRQVAVSAR